MYGSIIGDIAGSPYEHDKGSKTKDFPLFSHESRFTDDTIMTVAVAQGLMEAGRKADVQRIFERVQSSMRKWGAKYPDAGYGSNFKRWLKSKKPLPYESMGNGSAMRVSPAGWLYDNIEQVRAAAKATAMPTHNHPEGIKGAEATASAIYLARKGFSKDEIRRYIIENFGYDLSRTCDEIRPNYHHTSSCQGSVPEAITAFLEGSNFEDVVRTAVSLGGDTDTIDAIAGSIAEAFYGIPIQLIEEAKKRLPAEMVDVLDRFAAFLQDSADVTRH